MFHIVTYKFTIDINNKCTNIQIPVILFSYKFTKLDKANIQRFIKDVTSEIDEMKKTFASMLHIFIFFFIISNLFVFYKKVSHFLFAQYSVFLIFEKLLGTECSRKKP